MKGPIRPHGLGRTVAGVLAAFTLVALGQLGFTGTASADFSYRQIAEDCKTVTADLVRPDSGTAGDWATDTFHRSAKVCHLPVLEKTAVEVQSWRYSVEVTDKGTFTTKGVKSFTGATQKPGVKGTFHGSLGADLSYRGSFDAPKDWGLWLGVNPGNAYGTSDWIAHLWSDGYVAGKAEWGWKYETCNETLLNASAGNHGDITGLAKIPCYSVTFLDKCDGTVTVTLANGAPSGESVATYFIGKTKTDVGSKPVQVTASPVKGWVVVTARGHAPWKHRYASPICVTPTPTSTPVVPVDSGSTSLPVTGPNAAIYGGIGLSVLVAGGVVLLAARRRRIRFTA